MQNVILLDAFLAIFVLVQSHDPFLNICLANFRTFSNVALANVLEQNHKLKTCIWTRILRYNLKVGKIKKALKSMKKTIKK